MTFIETNIVLVASWSGDVLQLKGLGDLTLFKEQ